MKTKANNKMFKMCLINHIRMVRYDHARFLQIIAYIKQYIRIKFSEKGRNIPTDYVGALNIVENLVPVEEHKSDYGVMELRGDHVTLNFIGENVISSINNAISRAASDDVKSALRGIDLNMFENEFSDISSESSPAQVVPSSPDPEGQK